MSVAIASPQRSAAFPLRTMARSLPALVAWSAAAGLACVGIQHTHRHTANDPQIQLAEDAARVLAAGGSPQRVVPPGRVDLATSLATWVTVFDGAGQPLASNAVLDGRTPTPPGGVLRAARGAGENRLTWQPRPGVRSATVSVAVRGRPWVVTAGRSLREVEARTAQWQALVVLAWLAGSAGVVASAAIAEWLARHPGARETGGV